MTATAPKPAGGVSDAYAQAQPLGQCSALADPELIRQHEDLLAWPALITKWNELSWGERFGNEAPALPTYGGQSVGTPQAVPKATRAAAADITRDVRARLGDGRLRVLAYQEQRQLGDEPVLLPAELVAEATSVNWRQGTIAVDGMTFVAVRVIEAGDLAAAEPEAEPEPEPPATLPALIKVLVALFREDSAWTVAITADLAALVAARDPRFRPHDGPARPGRWNAATLNQRIRESRVEAREAAAT